MGQRKPYFIDGNMHGVYKTGRSHATSTVQTEKGVNNPLFQEMCQYGCAEDCPGGTSTQSRLRKDLTEESGPSSSYWADCRSLQWVYPPDADALFRYYPRLCDYQMRPFFFFNPAFQFRALMPRTADGKGVGSHCPKCKTVCSGGRWIPFRVVHDLPCVFYATTKQFDCPKRCGSFSAWDSAALNLLHPIVRRSCKIFFHSDTAVSWRYALELARIRSNGNSFKKWRAQQEELKHEHMLECLTAYNLHVQYHKETRASSARFFGMKSHFYPSFAPEVVTEHGYKDHPSPSIPVLSALTVAFINEQWTPYFRRNLTANPVTRLAMDVNHKVAKKMGGGATLLFTAIDLDTSQFLWSSTRL